MKRGIAALLLAMATLGVAPTASAQINAEQVLRIGQNVMSMNDYMLAIAYFNQAIKSKPYLYEPYFMRALAKVNLEDFKGAEEDCSIAIGYKKYLPELYRLRGFCRLVLEKDSLAIADFDEGLRQDPKDKWMMFYRAVALTEDKQYEKADTAFSNMLTMFPDFDEGFTQKARMNYLRGDTIAALDDIDKSLALTKGIINNYLLRAQINSERRQWSDVADDLDEAIRLEPQRADLYVNRATARYHDDDFAGTMDDLSEALTLDPDNRGALYNRALLRAQVRDLPNALADFSKVLEADPENFHALYNRALIFLQLRRWKDAIADFTEISRKYPKFYPLYYGIAQAREGMGDRTGAIKAMLYAEDMVRKYVANPKANPLDKPTIDDEKINSGGDRLRNDESEIDFMERYNQLVAVSAGEDVTLTYDDKIKGKVQDRTMNVDREPMFTLSYFDTRTSLRPLGNYFREIEDINSSHLLKERIYVSNSSEGSLDHGQIDRLFAIVDDYNASIASGRQRPIDYLGRAIAQIGLKNHSAAIDDLNRAIELNPGFTAAYIARAYARHTLSSLPDTDATSREIEIRSAAADLDKALELNPRLVFAWFDKGNLLFDAKSYDAALDCFNTAIRINPDFGEAYYNRGLTLMALGEIDKAFADLSHAGELGILPAYRLLKKLQ